jgi:hypothetical protein
MNLASSSLPINSIIRWRQYAQHLLTILLVTIFVTGIVVGVFYPAFDRRPAAAPASRVDRTTIDITCILARLMLPLNHPTFSRSQMVFVSQAVIVSDSYRSVFLPLSVPPPRLITLS